MKNLRKYHVLIGCLFAPMLILFALSGSAQMVGVRLGILSEIHLRAYITLPFLLLSVLMGIFVTVTTVLGVIMALRLSGNQKAVRISLVAGVLVPLICLLLGPKIETKKPTSSQPPPSAPSQ